MKHLKIAFINFVALALMLGGCEVIKAKKASRMDQTGVQRIAQSSSDSSAGGSLKKSDNISKEQYDWYRTTMQYLPGQYKDTNVTNVYNYPQQPATIIYEGGKGAREQSSSTFDSSWFQNALATAMARVDSLTQKLEMSEKNKQSETKGVGLVMVIIIVIAGIVVYALLRNAIRKFKIVKR